MKKASTICLLMIFTCVVRAHGATEKTHFVPLSGRTSSLDNYTGTPDENGVLETYRLILPHYEKGLLFIHSPYTNRSGNRYFGEVFERGDIKSIPDGMGQFMLLKIKDGQYVAVLPVATDRTMSWFITENNEVYLKTGTWGTDSVRGHVPLFITADSENPYQAAYEAWRDGLDCVSESVRGRFRGEKDYPTPFKYLGWCSWEAYHRNVSEKLILDVIDHHKSSGIPMKYIVIDGGHWSFEKGVGPKKDIFPNGYKKITDAMDGKPVKWLGLHYQSLGWKEGINPAPDNDLGEYNKYTITVPTKQRSRLVPAENQLAMDKWMEYMMSFGLKDGASFVKIDFLKDPMLVYSGLLANDKKFGNPVALAAKYKIAMEKVLNNSGLGLMNCNGNNYPNPFFAKHSNSTRCSEDYHKNRLPDALSHTYNSYSTILHLGHLYWGDHDMFHSSDTLAGQLMAVSKAMSGGPIFFSDKPGYAVKENIDPLCYEDGLLVRPLAPGIMSEDSLFLQKGAGGGLFKAFAPLANYSLAIHVMNLNTEPGPRRAAISVKDYENGNSMMQPWLCQWCPPEGGLVIYDVLAGDGKKFSGNEPVVLDKTLDHKLYQLSPIYQGWSFIGRTDKYLSAATGEIVHLDGREMKLHLHEAGPFAIYSSRGKPQADGCSFTDTGNGIFIADLPIGPGKAITVTR